VPTCRFFIDVSSTDGNHLSGPFGASMPLPSGTPSPEFGAATTGQFSEASPPACFPSFIDTSQSPGKHPESA